PRLVLQLKLELQQGADGHRRLRLDEEAPTRDIDAVLLAEFIDGRALEADLQRDRRALVPAGIVHPRLRGAMIRISAGLSNISENLDRKDSPRARYQATARPVASPRATTGARRTLQRAP